MRQTWLGLTFQGEVHGRILHEIAITCCRNQRPIVARPVSGEMSAQSGENEPMRAHMQSGFIMGLRHWKSRLIHFISFPPFFLWIGCFARGWLGAVPAGTTGKKLPFKEVIAIQGSNDPREIGEAKPMGENIFCVSLLPSPCPLI